MPRSSLLFETALTAVFGVIAVGVSAALFVSGLSGHPLA